MEKPAQACGTGSSLPRAGWRLLGLLPAVRTRTGQVGARKVRERVPTYLSSGGRMISTPDPANCASCPENYYSVCPVQGTKGPCDRSTQQCPAQGGPGPAPIRPSLGHLLLPPSPPLLPTTCQGPHPQPSGAGRRGGKCQPSRLRPTGSRQPTLLARERRPTLREMPLSASTKVGMAGCAGESRREWGERQKPDPQSQAWGGVGVGGHREEAHSQPKSPESYGLAKRQRHSSTA